MKNSNFPTNPSFVAAFWLFANVTLPIITFCLLRDVVSSTEYSGSRLAWLIWTVLANVVLPVWHLWLHFRRAEGSVATRFQSIIERSGRRIGALFLFDLPLLFVLTAEANSNLAGICGFVWIVGLFIFVCMVLMFLTGIFNDPDERQSVDLGPLVNDHMHYSKGTISLRQGGYRF